MFGIAWLLAALGAGGAALSLRAHGGRAFAGVAIFAVVALLLGVSAIARGVRRM